MKKIAGGCLLFIIISLFYTCSSQKDSPKTLPVPVTAAKAVSRTIPVQIEAIGAVEAFQTITIKSQITGQIKRVFFKEGQDVKKGSLLIELDCRSNEAALRQFEANLAKDRAQARYAEEQARRYDELLKKDYVAREQYDQAQANFESLQATLKADEALLENSRVQVQYCSIYSPVDGRIGKLLVNEGNIANANSTEIAVINQLQPISVSFAVPEKRLAQIKKFFGEKKLEVDAMLPGDERPEKGVLTFVDNAIDRATATINLKGTFTNESKRLWPGQYVDVILMLTTLPNVILVSSQSVEQDQAGQHVYVVKPDSTVEMRPVTIGENFQTETIVLKGVQPGEQVVTDGQLRLIPGAKVTVTETK